MICIKATCNAGLFLFTLGRYVELLAVALTENDTEFAKSVVKSLVEARKNQENFVVKFLPDGERKYFK